LGLSYFEYGEFDDALACYKKAIDIEASSVHYNNRGLAYFHFDKLEEAKDDFLRAIEIDKKNPTIYFNLGNVYLNWKGKKKFDEAIKMYDTALRI
jgi:tetratricopeptide (TPR) repeat protein